MTVRVITGSKQQIAEQVSQLPGEVREAIVFIEESPATTTDLQPAAGAEAGSVEDLFAEMQPYMVDVDPAVLVDDSRDAIYEREEE